MPAKTDQRRKPRKATATPVPGSAWGSDPAYSVEGAAVAVGVSRKAMYDYVGSKRIGHVKIGGQVRIRLSQIQAFIAKGTTPAV